MNKAIIVQIKIGDPAIVIDMLTELFRKTHGFIRENCIFKDELKTEQDQVAIDFPVMDTSKNNVLDIFGDKIAIYFKDEAIMDLYLEQKFLKKQGIKIFSDISFSENSYVYLKRNRSIEKKEIFNTQILPFLKYKNNNKSFAVFFERNLQEVKGNNIFTSFGLCKENSNLKKIKGFYEKIS